MKTTKEAKNKAKEMIWDVLPLIKGWESPEKTEQAKKIALKSIEQILMSNPTIKGSSDDLITMIVQTKAFYYMVKYEIENFN
ncbi:hypothetical protein [Seonamhaeicola sp.]|uniref:hypothetical protein n=1 Tax=Seonamhaeicola sp. TaxID=1912245 RepID=UPI003569ACB0